MTRELYQFRTDPAALIAATDGRALLQYNSHLNEDPWADYEKGIEIFPRHLL
jgi:hypothetical protein